MTVAPTSNSYEVNFDGLVGPSHNYAGLAYGNLASNHNRSQPSNPKAAALQGLDKMARLIELGLKQGVLAPQQRPDLDTLRQLGFNGSDAQVLNKAAKRAPQLLAACYSASSMWVANAATVSASIDSHDQRLQITPANLCNQFHRSIEPPFTAKLLQATFNHPDRFHHHPPLPSHPDFGDEGAANHTRLCTSYDRPGVSLFCYGRSETGPQPQRYPARQSLAASQAIARAHGLQDSNVVFAQQNPEAIDQGVFHNDVIAVGNRQLLFCHQQAFVDQPRLLERLGRCFEQHCLRPLEVIEVPATAVSLEQAVSSYLFNSQLVSLDDRQMALILPQQCQDKQEVWSYLQQLVDADNPIQRLEVVDLHQSMRNGGGPACLRLRVVLNSQELAAVNQATLLNPAQLERLRNWVEHHYRDRLVESDLADPQLLDEIRCALDQLTQLLNLGSIYPFQQQ